MMVRRIRSKTVVAFALTSLLLAAAPGEAAPLAPSGCPGCVGSAASSNGTAGCIQVIASAAVSRSGVCDDDGNGDCISNTAPAQTCRFSYSIDVVVTEPCSTPWHWKHEVCPIARDGQRIGTCTTIEADMDGPSSAQDITDLTCGTEQYAEVSVGGNRVGFIQLKCSGCLPAPQ